MFNNWLREFAVYFNQGSSRGLNTIGGYIEQPLIEAANVFVSKYEIDPFSCTGNFENYWNLVQYSLTQKGMNYEEFSELTSLAMSFNEGKNWW